MARTPTYKTPEELRQAADSYFAWADQNPIRGQKTVRKDNGDTDTRDELYPRPYTFEGLAIYLGIADWQAFANNNRQREGFGEVFAYIRTRVRSNQIEGSMVGLYREGLTARLNGIAENMNINEKAAINLLADAIE